MWVCLCMGVCMCGCIRVCVCVSVCVYAGVGVGVFVCGSEDIQLPTRERASVAVCAQLLQL